ncbi:PucR family transcriptional regulator [Pseudonocardia abyssalis]|uniref:Helix-turn-helix domain-containing protein n=1 Tax=Pseudonocardia abyssalis TaxID=2792008 RepID=A0ABS6URE9_9PSEU|nr:helix-turn-helix domain-containing protein [Pseudonocardia abyssalis]MBW0113751.1 helix-turn-helix domain-containing protein [Pseudonocardia abyssalis]MBW0134824.1 helix-turn-helix domain-containing protein [Pseudonocardia abyssalis]
MALPATIVPHIVIVEEPATDLWGLYEARWLRAVLQTVHDAVHDLVLDVVACSYVPVGGRPESLCGRPDWTTALLFERLAGNVLGSNIAVEAQRGGGHETLQFSAMLPLARRGRVVGRIQLLTDTAPDMDVLCEISQLAEGQADACAPRAADAVPAEAVGLGSEEQEDLLHAFAADGDERPTVRCLLERVAELLGGSVVMQTARLIVVDSIGASDRVALDATSRREREVLLPTASPGIVTVLPARDGRGLRGVISVQTTVGQADYLVAEILSDTPRARAVLRQAATILSWLLKMRVNSHEEPARRRAAIVADLLRASELSGVAVRAAALGHDLNARVRCIVFALAESSDEADPVRLEKVVQEEFRSGTSTGPTAMVALSDGHVVVLDPDDGPARPGSPVKRAIAAAGRAGLIVTCGISPACQGPAAVAPAILEARRAADVLRRTGRTMRAISSDDLGVFGLLFSESDGLRLDRFVSHWLGPLTEYDAAAGAQLTQTLGQLLDRATMVDAASSLFIHISTLKYRAKRIEEILGVDMRDPDVAFNLRLALKLLNIRTTLNDCQD